MSATLTLTDAGLAAVVDAANTGLASVRMARLALGSGVGGDAATATTLITERNIENVGGSSTAPGRIAVRADFTPAEVYTVTEVGLFARVGAGGAEFLFAYWGAANVSGGLVSTVRNAVLTIVGIVEVTRSAAEIDITPRVDVTVGSSTDGLVAQTQHATTEIRGIVELATSAEAARGVDRDRAVTPVALQAALQATLQAVSGAGLPTGAITDFAGTVVPAGWLECDGAILAQSTPHATLRALLASRYALATDPQGTVRLPNCARRVRVGRGDTGTDTLGARVGDTGGAETHALTSQEMPAHTHDDGSLSTGPAGTHTHGSGSYGTNSAGSHTHTLPVALDAQEDLSGTNRTVRGVAQLNNISTGSAGSHTHSVSGASGSAGSHVHNITGDTGSTGGGQAHSIMQPSLVVMTLIKT